MVRKPLPAGKVPLIQSWRGLVLITGPTGSGKSSTPSITLLSTIDIFQRLGVFVGHGMERPTLEEQHLRTDEVYGSAVGEVGSK